MAWEILIHEEVEAWIAGLSEEEYKKVSAALDALEVKGPLLGRPLADRIKGSRYQNLKELRPPGSAIRILYYFDHARRAVLLVAGDKSNNWREWYVKNILIAESRIEEEDCG